MVAVGAATPAGDVRPQGHRQHRTFARFRRGGAKILVDGLRHLLLKVEFLPRYTKFA